MSTLIKNVEICDVHSAYHQQVKNVLVENGKITKITDEALEANEVVDGTNLKLSTGWVDMRVSLEEPGNEFKEDLASTCAAAIGGGITEILGLPNTQPTIQTKESIAFIESRTAQSLVNVHVSAALTKKCAGEEMTDMVDLHHAGAIAFTDGHHTTEHTGVLVKSLQYLEKIGGLVINKPFDTYLSKNGQMHEGINSTMLGFKAIPSIAEYLTVQKNIELLKYAGTGKLHFSCISTKESVALIREAKAEGLAITADIASHQLAFDDSVISSFDANYKVMPPFRLQDDIQALKEGLADGTIDCIVSDHTPQDIESKNLEFNYADFGIIGLETLYATINTYSGLATEEMVELMTSKPRKVLNLPSVNISEGAEANLTLFDENKVWEVKKSEIISKSKNTPFLGKKLKGKAVAVFNKGQFEVLA